MYRTRAQISVGERFVVSRVARGDGPALVVKSMRDDRPGPRSAALLRHEWDVLHDLDLPRIEHAYALEEDEHGPLLLLEDAGSQTLSDLIDHKPLGTARFFELAIPMVEAMAGVHQRGFIHRDICPANFVIGEFPTLIDFETATATPTFSQTASAPGELEGTLSYIAPEQTGRMNRSVDHRADLYALGATFYEMLTGAPPFSTFDPIELLHAHVARRPHAPAVVNTAVPTALSNIVIKLLSKMPEWRYQTADALKHDLEEARLQWQQHGEIQPFELGRRDVPYGLLLGRNLYGRDKELAMLRSAIERSAVGPAEVVFVSGPEGIGKTALVHRARELSAARYRWLTGRGDRLYENVPYEAMLDPFRRWLRELTQRPPDETAAIRERIQAGIARDGRVITELLPELEQLIGEQPGVADVGPVEAEQRCMRVFIAFVRSLIDSDNPLVLFIDDLQWADPGSIKLLTALAIERDLRSLLVIGTLRSEDAGPAHRVALAAARISDETPPVTTIELAALDADAISALLCDALRVEPQSAAPLAQVIETKTAGNPFFMLRFLGHLNGAGLLIYDTKTGRWSWDIDRIEGAGVTENVVALLAQTIGRFPRSVREVLATAAGIGNEFGLAMLAGVRGETQRDVARALWKPVHEGLIVPVIGLPRFPWAGGQPVELGSAYAPAYRFVHNRIQDAAYQLHDPNERKLLHLRIGRWLLANTPERAFDRSICAIVDQLARASDGLAEDERRQLADLELRAGRISRAAAAYESALGYFRAGLELLPEPATAYDSWFALVRNAAECAALAGDHASCERIAGNALTQASEPSERAALHDVLAQSNALRGAHAETLLHGREALRILGVVLPEASATSVEAERTRIRGVLRGVSDHELLGARAMEDADERTRLRLLAGIAAATWFIAPDLFTLVSGRALELTIQRGLAPDSPFAFSAYAVTLAMQGEYEPAYRFGRLAVTLAERASDKAQECRTLMVLGGHLSPWRAPLEDSIPLLRRSYARGLEAGDLEYAAYARANLIFTLWVRGAEPSAVLEETDATLAFYRRIGHVGGIAYVRPFVQAARCLTDLTRHRASFDDDGFDEARFLAECNNGLALAVYHVLRLQTCYLLGEPARALEYAVNGERWLPDLRTIVLVAEHVYYSALALASLAITKQTSARLHALLDQLEIWARHSPATFGHKRDLVVAELARIEDQPDVVELYERAIASAEWNGCAHEAALGHELCARFLIATHRGGEQQHVRAAIRGYAAWGASAKVALLVAEFPGTADAARPPPLPIEGTRWMLDLKILLRAAEAISSELVFERLVQSLMQLSLKAASAERAALVLDRGQLVVAAVASANGELALEHTPLETSQTIPVSVICHVARSGEVIVLGDASRDDRFAGDPYIAKAGVRSVLGVPLRRQDQTIGILYFENNLTTDAFTPDRVEVFRLLSAQMTAALHNSLLFEERQRAEQVPRMRSSASAALAASLDYEHVVARVGELVVPALADLCVVDVLEGNALRPAVVRHLDPDKQVRVEELRRRAPVDLDSPQPQAEVLRTRTPLLVTEVTEEGLRSDARDDEHFQHLQALSLRSLMVLPMVARGRALGTLTLAITESDRRYGDAELAVAAELAYRAAMALENALLYRDLQEQVRLRSERDRYLRTIFRQLPGAVWATDRHLRFTFAEGNLPSAPQLEARRLLGTSVYDFIGTHEPTEPAIETHLAALAGKATTLEYQLLGRWYRLRIEPLRDQTGETIGCVGAAFDNTEHRGAEERLARNEARLREAQRVAHVGSFEWDIALDTVTWTDELHRIYGLEPGTFEGSFAAYLAFVHPDDLARTKALIFEAFRAGREFVYEHRIVREDGSVRTLHTRGEVIKDAGGNPTRLVGTCWDVTDLIEATQARERLVSLLEATVEATADGILVVDRAGSVVVVNQRFRSMWKLSPEFDVATESAIVDAMARQAEAPDAFREAIATLQARPQDERVDLVRLKDGRIFERYSGPQRIGDSVVGRVWSYRDISEREQLLRRAVFLADATRLLVSLDVERALDGVAHLAVPYLGEGCAIDVFWDGGPRRLLAVSHDASRPISPEIHPAVLAGNATIYPEDSTSYLGIPLVTKAGIVGAITLAASSQRKYTQADLDLAEDLGRRAALAIENANLYKRAQEAVRGRDEFLSIASHEIRGPIMSLHLAVQMLGKGQIPPDQQPKTFAIIERADRRLAQFVDELLDLSRIRTGGLRYEFEHVDLAEVARNVTNQLAGELARSGSQLTLTTDGQVYGEWDRFRVDQIVTNLLSNAIKFGLGNPIEIHVTARDGHAVLVVRDRGMGIDKDIQDRIFEPFERGVSVRHYGGLGLGLYIVKKLVEGMGGVVSVESAPSAGATFTVTLPMARDHEHPFFDSDRR
jgi:PAS domain S-box-containing protein